MPGYKQIPVHLLPTSCHICGSAEPHPPTPSHRFWSNAEAEAYFAAEDARLVSVRYPDGTTDPAAHCVNTYRPY